uniref:hypothetical protein n=1 Tax=Roseburia inulinivorans TaxID=360807 RepID=UPI004025892C
FSGVAAILFFETVKNRIITVSHEKIFSFAKTKNLYFFAKINIVFLRSMPYTKLLKRKEYAC